MLETLKKRGIFPEGGSIALNRKTINKEAVCLSSGLVIKPFAMEGCSVSNQTNKSVG